MKKLILGLVSLAIIQFYSCSNNETKMSELKQKFESKFPKGSGIKNIIQYFDSTGIEHSEFISDKNEIYAVFRNEEDESTVKTDLKIIFKFDTSGKLSSTEFKELFTGP